MAKKAAPIPKGSLPGNRRVKQTVIPSRPEGKERAGAKTSPGSERKAVKEQLAQREAELAVINNIGQTLTEGLDLQSTLERVGERLRTVLQVDNFGITAFDVQTGMAISHYVYLKGKRVIPDGENFSLSKYRLGMRFASRMGGKPLIVNTRVEKYWNKIGSTLHWSEAPKSLVMIPMLAGRDLVGSITFLDYEKENAFQDLPIGMLETIAANMGTAIQNVRLFDETQHLLKETEQRAAELQIINNIGQTLAQQLDLNTMIERVGDKLRASLEVENIGIGVYDQKNNIMRAPYIYRAGKRLSVEPFPLNALNLRASKSGKTLVVNTKADKHWHKFGAISAGGESPKSFVMVPLMAGREMVGGIAIQDFENENAFPDLSVSLLEAIASNMGTAIQNARLLEEAREAHAAAEQANKAKSTFLANMSHELRTPLNAIIGFTRIVKKKAEGTLPEKQIENLEKVLISSEHLLGLINTVLDIAKIEAGRMDVIPTRFSLSALADQCATLAMPLLKPEVELEKEVDDTIGILFSDQDKIKQIVLNLISNAAKFTHQGNILLRVQKSGEENVSISVSDSGIGISEESLGRVFEEFQQADNTTTREYGGTGLGLTISRDLARLLGGDLTARSERGKGSTFTLTVPIRYGNKSALSSDLNADSVKPAESQESDDPMQVKANGSGERTKKILIVEDTEINIHLLTQLLEDDYNLLIARDGAQGVNMALEENPDLILMDISLPIMDGYEATRRIRTTLASIPIIGLSAHAKSGDAEKAREAGCNDYLTKPVNEERLIQKLKEHLR